MGDSPNREDYKPSAAEKASAAVAMAEHKYFKQKYDPLLQKMRDASKTDDSADVLRGRANADTMQTLAGNASYDRAATAASGGAEAQAYQAQLAQADKAGLDIKNKMQLDVLGTSREQAADGATGMTEAGNLGASKVLSQAKAKQDVRLAKMGALGEMATSLVIQGAKNMKTGGKVKTQADGTPMTDKDGNVMRTERGSFFRPRDSSGNSVKGFGARLGHTDYFGTNPFGRN